MGVGGTRGGERRAAPADQVFNLTYPVTGSTFIKKINSSIPLGPGTLTSAADLTTSTLTATLTLPPATGSFKELGFVPVTPPPKLIPARQPPAPFTFTAT